MYRCVVAIDEYPTTSALTRTLTPLVASAVCSRFFISFELSVTVSESMNQRNFSWDIEAPKLRHEPGPESFPMKKYHPK